MSDNSRFDALLDAIKAEYADAHRKARDTGTVPDLRSIGQLGTLIREQRKKQRMTLQELSDLSDVAYSTLSKIENGDTAIQLRSLNRVLGALGLKLWIG